MTQLKRALDALESCLNAEGAAKYEIVRDPLFHEWFLKDKESLVKNSLVVVAGDVIRWKEFARNRYSELEDLELVSSWARSRASARS